MAYDMLIAVTQERCISSCGERSLTCTEICTAHEVSNEKRPIELLHNSLLLMRGPLLVWCSLRIAA